MTRESLPDETAPHGLDEGIALVHRAQDGGEWRPVVDWLARNPALAESLARFVGGERLLEAELAPPAPAPVRTGTVLGDFELREVLGRGKMGEVYRAQDLRIARTVAVKVMNTCGAMAPDELMRSRFEAEAMAAMSHPNVVPVFQYGEVGGVPYLVMPLMPGGTLAEWLKSLGPDRLLEPKRAAEIVRDVALGVHHAHQHQLIHRDLKPANILLDRDNKPHVADFGLAWRTDATVTHVAGTAAYMAPEQARGERRLTTAVDIHALGAILFELLTGRTPFGGADVPSVIRNVADENAPAVRTFRHDVPRDLETICAKCLKKDPSERYPSAEALAADLTRFLQGDPIDGHRGWLWGTISRAIDRRRETIGMTSSGVLFWGTASTFLAMAVMQTAVLLGWPLWVSQTAIAYYLVAWLALMWGLLVVRRDALTTVERGSTAIYFGAKFSCMAVLPTVLWLHGGNPVYALPPFMALVGLAIYFHGALYWGRFYLLGLVFFAVTAVLPLVPVPYWPGVYGTLLGGAQLVAGFHVRRTARDAEASRRVEAN